ncbi:hypothetical protein MMC07_005967 [Pseudocyphellaria aurata]|nr:hypothetical protein [Pseudocyphellaria aurata]
MPIQFVHLVCLVATVDAFPQLLYPDNVAVTVALDRPDTFETISPGSGHSGDLLKAFYSSAGTTDFDASMAVPESPENTDTATDWVDKLNLDNLGTNLAYISPDAGGKFDVPIQPSSPSLFDLASTKTSDPEVAGVSVMDEGIGGGTVGVPSVGSWFLLAPQAPPQVPPQGSRYKPIVPTEGNPKRPPEGQNQPWVDNQGRHEDEFEPPDCTHFPGNSRVLFCCKAGGRVPTVAKADPSTREPNCNNVLLDAFSPYFYIDDRKSYRPITKPPDHYRLGPPALQSIPNLEDEKGREIWTGENVSRDRKCPKKYLESHGIDDNIPGAQTRFRGPT